ncbi:MAG: ATP synthase F0 subunit B [Actinobacteria bacterium]|nr:MAG: ATP synthase F0 subunit B [Actinomycetota bacterium]
MNVLASLYAAAAAPADPMTKSWIWPERAEIVYGCTASILIFVALVKFGGPVIKKGMSARTEKIQKDLDSGKNDKASAQAEATSIRAALGDIAAERTRILAEADAQATALLTEGRARVTTEMAGLEQKAEADIAAAAARSGDELRAEIAQLAGVATERVVSSSLDDSTKQALIENFISNVGAAR